MNNTPQTHPAEANTKSARASRDQAARNRFATLQTMCPMGCGNPAHVCKARGRCVYVVTDLRKAQ